MTISTKRNKFDIAPIVNTVIENIPTELFESSTTKFLDPACGGGQFLAGVIAKLQDAGHSAENIKSRVFGFETNRFAIRDAKFKLQNGATIEKRDFLNEDITMKDLVVLSNPPYNDGSAGRNPIYQKFLTKIIELNPAHVEIIIPSNWFSQDHNKLGKEVRESLLALGVHSISLNNPETFGDGATVNTCTASCSAGYVGNITLTNGNSTRDINDIREQILYNTDEIGVNLLERLRPVNPYTTYQGIKGNTDSWRVVTSYRKERFDIDPLATLKLMSPNNTSQGSYRVFAEFDTQAEAEEALEFYKSFWHSKLIKFVMCQTRNSTTLDNPQLRWVPVMKSIDKVYTDEDLYNYFGLNNDEIEYVETFLQSI